MYTESIHSIQITELSEHVVWKSQAQDTIDYSLRQFGMGSTSISNKQTPQKRARELNREKTTHVYIYISNKIRLHFGNSFSKAFGSFHRSLSLSFSLILSVFQYLFCVFANANSRAHTQTQSLVHFYYGICIAESMLMLYNKDLRA